MHRHLSLRVFWNKGGKEKSAELRRKNRNALPRYVDRYEFSSLRTLVSDAFEQYAVGIGMSESRP
jgi:hypothetical protein